MEIASSEQSGCPSPHLVLHLHRLHNHQHVALEKK
jgi:hypothetical protein